MKGKVVFSIVDWLIVTIVIGLLAFVFATNTRADGPVYEVGVQDSKLVNCTDATEDEAGNALPVDQIKRVEIGFCSGPVPDGTNCSQFISMPGGCAANPDKVFDLTYLGGEGQWYEIGWTIADYACPEDPSGTECYSKPSVAFPFEYRTVVHLERPTAPVMTE